MGFGQQQIDDLHSLRTVFNFGDFELDEDAQELWRCGERVQIQTKPLQVLARLARQRGRTLKASELLSTVWADVSVSKHALSSAVRDLRRALHDTQASEPIVATERGRGYRLTLPVTTTAVSMGEPSMVQGPPEPDPDPGPPPMIGRDAELDRLRATLEQTRQGNCRLSLVRGAPGAGKTYLAEALLRHAQATDSLVVWARCPATGDQTTPLWPFRQVLRALTEQHSRDSLRALLPHHHAGLHGLLSELTDPAPAPAAAMDAPAAMTRLRSLLQALSASVPSLVLVFDELNWVDPSSVQLIDSLLSPPADLRLHLVCCLRDRGSAQGHKTVEGLDRLARNPRCSTIEVRPLGAAAVADALQAQLGQVPGQRAVEAILEATGGHPFNLGELLRALSASAQVVGFRAAEDIPVPPGVRVAVGAALEARSECCRALLRAGALLGPTFELPLAAAKAGMDEAAALSTAQEAYAANLLRPLMPGGSRCAFVDGFTRSTILEAMPPCGRP